MNVNEWHYELLVEGYQWGTSRKFTFYKAIIWNRCYVPHLKFVNIISVVLAHKVIQNTLQLNAKFYISLVFIENNLCISSNHKKFHQCAFIIQGTYFRLWIVTRLPIKRLNPNYSARALSLRNHFLVHNNLNYFRDCCQ